MSFSVGNIMNVHGKAVNVEKSRWHELVRLACSKYTRWRIDPWINQQIQIPKHTCRSAPL